MNIVIDTSIWIEFLKGNALYFDKMMDFLENENVIALAVIFAELLQGAKNIKEIEIIKSYYYNLQKYNGDIEQLTIKAGNIAGINNWPSKGIGLIDSMIIMTAIEMNAKIWTLDKKLIKLLESEYPMSHLEIF